MALRAVAGGVTGTPVSVAQGGTGATTPQAARDNLGVSSLLQPPYVSGRWYLPPDIGATNTGALTANAIRLIAVRIMQPVTITALGLRIATGSAGNAALAIYASDPTTKYPTGTPVASVSGLSTATATTVSATLGSNVTLQAGLYWFAVNADNASAIAVGAAATTGQGAASLVGATTLNGLLPGNAPILSRVLAQTYGTWPDMTTTNGSESAVSFVVIFGFQIA